MVRYGEVWVAACCLNGRVPTVCVRVCVCVCVSARARAYVCSLLCCAVCQRAVHTHTHTFARSLRSAFKILDPKKTLKPKP